MLADNELFDGVNPESLVQFTHNSHPGLAHVA